MKPARSTIIALAFTALLALPPASLAATPPEKQNLFEAGTEGYHTYRVPGLLVTRSGVVLATAEARHGHGGDWDDNDALLRRSLDGGRTWEKPQVMANSKTYGPGPISNFVLLSDRDSGAVHALYCYNYSRVFHMQSSDDGATFSAPVEITPVLEEFRRDYPWRVVATGPAHGTQLRSGRFIVPVWMSDGSGKEMGKGKLGHRPSIVSLIYSDDRGRSWHRGEIVCRTDEHCRNPSETIMVELADGRVLLNIRTECKENRRLVSISPDGIRGWSEPRFDSSLLEPICMASLLRLTWPGAGQRSRIVFANPDNLENQFTKPGGVWHDRKRLTVKMSYDECSTWPVSKVLEEGPSGYSDLAVLPDHTILCIYECGMINNQFITKNIALARFNLAWLTDGRDSPPAGSTRSGADTSRAPLAPLPLAEHIMLNGLSINLKSPPKGLVVRPALGLLTAEAVDGQVVYRTSQPGLFETRAVVTPRGDYLLMFPEGQHYGGCRGKKVNELMSCRWSDDDGHTWSDVRLIRPINDPDYKGMSVMRMCETSSGAAARHAHR
jgi:sialidase-1